MIRSLSLFAVSLAAITLGSNPLLAQDAPKPATLAEIRDAIDWSKMPKPPGAHPGRTGLATCTYKASGTFLEAAAFFRRNLPTLGWKEDATPIPGVDQKDYLSLTFEKGEMRLSITGYRPDPKAPMTIILNNNGNVDTRTIPKPADAKYLSNGRLAAFFTTASKPEEAAEFCRKGILERGWKEVRDDTAKFHAKEGRIVLRFQQNAMELGVVAAKNRAGQTEVSISSHVRYALEPSEIRKALTPGEIPTPASEKEYLAVLDLRTFPLMKDARKRERQSQAIARSNAITCQAPGTLEGALAFFRKEFKERGWKETHFDNEIDDRAELDFEKQGYRVSVRVGQRKNEDVQISVVNHGNIDLRQLPYPPGAEITPERGTFVNCTSTVPVKDAEDFYRSELTKSGWKEVKARVGSVHLFLQGASILQIEMQKDAEGRTTLKVTPSLMSAEK